MCKKCWKEYGSPKIMNKNVLGAVALITRVYEQSHSGGNLHIQLDDWNLEDEFFEEFKEYCETPVEQVKIEKECFQKMKSLSIAERASAVSFFWRF